MDIEKINSREFAKRVVNYNSDPTIQKELQAIHFELFKKNFRVNCGSCIKQAFVDIREKLNKTITNQSPKTMAEFELKKGINGISKQIHFEHNIITNDNLTDEYAKRILKKMPGHIITFSKYPANWRELVFGEKQETVQEIIQESKQEIVFDNSDNKPDDVFKVLEKRKYKKGKK